MAALLLVGLTVWQPGSSAQNEQPQVGPGVPHVGSAAPRSAASSSKAGSILFFHKYTSDLSQPSVANTLVTITNTNPRDGVAVRLSWVHDCAIETEFITFAANQTRSFLASSESPGHTGHLMALAVNSLGVPTQHNWLVGSASYRDARGYEGTYNAVGVAKRSAGTARLAAGNLAELLFNNTDYDRLPKVVAIDNLQNQDPQASQASGSAAKTDLVIYSPLAHLASTPSQDLKFTAIAYDQSGRPYIQTHDKACGVSGPAASLWTTPALNSFITATRQGWASFGAAAGAASTPVFGLSLTEGVNSARHSARQMPVLQWLDSFKMTVPVILPNGAPNDANTQNQPEAPGGALGASEMKTGSLLLFPRYTSGFYGNSTISLTNAHPTERARVRLFFTGLVEPVLVNETIVSLLPYQTATLLPNDFAPNQRGWVLALAIDSRGLPVQFNNLIGSAQVVEQNGQVGGYTALAFAKNSPGSLSRNQDGQTTDLLFDDANFDRLPATQAMSAVPSQLDNATMLGYVRPPLSMLEAPNTRGSLSVTLYDHLLANFAAVVGLTEARLNTIRPNASQPPITNTLLRGQRGWLKLNSASPVFPWMNNAATARFNVPQVDGSSWTGGVNGGACLHVLTKVDSYLLRVTATNPNNHAPIAEFEPIEVNLEARGNRGVNVRLDGRISRDPDDSTEPLSYKWFDNDRQISTAKVTDYRFGLGTHILKLMVTDGSDTVSDPRQHLFFVQDTAAPTISGVPSNISKVSGSNVGVALNYPLPTAYDMVDGAVTVTASKPPGTLFPIGRTTVYFTATDSSGNVASAKMDINITKGNATLPTIGGVASNKLPALGNINDQYVIVGKTKIITLQASDADNDPVTFRLTGAPSFARIDQIDPVQRTAKLIILAREGDPAATTNVRVIATDNRGGEFATLPFRIYQSDFETVENGDGTGPGPNPTPTPTPNPTINNPPVARAAPLAPTAQATSKQGAVIRLDGSASSDPDLDPLKYEWKDNGAKIAEGAVVDITLPVGTHSLTLTVSDGRGGTNTTAPMVVEVLPRPLTIASINKAAIPQFNTTQLTITGTGFFNGADANSSTKVRFDCSSYCQGGSQITVTINSIEEDLIVVTLRTTQSTPTGNRDCVLTNPNGATARLARSNFVVK